MTNDMNNTFQDLASACQEIERLRAELESHGWEITPAMAQAKLDELNREVERLKSENARLAAALDKEQKRTYGMAILWTMKSYLETALALIVVVVIGVALLTCVVKLMADLLALWL